MCVWRARKHDAQVLSVKGLGVLSMCSTNTILLIGTSIGRGSCDARRNSQRHDARSTKMASRREESREADSAYANKSENRLESSDLDHVETCAGTGPEASQRDTSLLRSGSNGSACQRDKYERSRGSSRRSDARETRPSSRKTKSGRADATDANEEKDSPSVDSVHGHAKTEDTREQARPLSEQGQSFDDRCSTAKSRFQRVPSGCLDDGDASSSRFGSMEHRTKQNSSAEHCRDLRDMDRRLEKSSVGVSEIVRQTAGERRRSFADQEDDSKKNSRGRKSLDDRGNTSTCRLSLKDHFSNCTHSSDETLVPVSKRDNLAGNGSSSEDTAVLLNDWERKLEQTQMEQSFACSASRSQQFVERQHSSASQRESSVSRRATDARKGRSSEAATARSELSCADERAVQSATLELPKTNLEGVVDQSDSEATYTVGTSYDENDASSPSAGISGKRETLLLHEEGASRENSTVVFGDASKVRSPSAKSCRQATATSTEGISCDAHRSGVQPLEATSATSCAFGPGDVHRSAKVSKVVQRDTDVREAEDNHFCRAPCRYNRRGDPDYVGLDAGLAGSSHQVSKQVVELHGSERSRVQLQLEQADEALAAISHAKQESEQARTASLHLPTILSSICREFAVHFLATVDAPIGELPVAVDGVPAILAMLVRIVSLLDVLVAQDSGESCNCGFGHSAPSVGAAATDAVVRALSDSAGLGGVLPLCVRIMHAECRSLPAPSSNELLLHAVITVRLLVEWVPPIGVPRPRGQLHTLGAHDAMVSAALTLQHDLSCEKQSVSSERSHGVDAISCEEAITTRFAQLALVLDSLGICTGSQEFVADFANGRRFSSGGKFKDDRSSQEAYLPKTFCELSADVLERVASIPFSLNACSTGGGALSVAIDAAAASSIRLFTAAASLQMHDALSETICQRVATSLSSILAERPLTLRLAVALRGLACSASPANRGNWFRSRVIHTDNFFKELRRSMAAEDVVAGCVRAVRHSLEVARTAQSEFEDDSQDGSCNQASVLVGQSVQAAAAGAAAHVALFGALYSHVEVIVRSLEGSGSNRRGSNASAELERILQDGEKESSNMDDVCMVELAASQVQRKGAVESALRSLRRSIRMTCMAPYLRR
eukprot:TRINITY_DN2069_c0_g1_i5.p1 TRINITY_DN2069_c0_g1~~TRINITY_DN2069_c0_g1_i5.p1  ORF type:complete len:1124 (-),score=145.39 TRINITY_DN2069_c0_g1_i5:296-3667(-)